MTLKTCMQFQHLGGDPGLKGLRPTWTAQKAPVSKMNKPEGIFTMNDLEDPEE